MLGQCQQSERVCEYRCVENATTHQELEFSQVKLPAALSTFPPSSSPSISRCDHFTNTIRFLDNATTDEVIDSGPEKTSKVKRYEWILSTYLAFVSSRVSQNDCAIGLATGSCRSVSEVSKNLRFAFEGSETLDLQRNEQIDLANMRPMCVVVPI